MIKPEAFIKEDGLGFFRKQYFSDKSARQLRQKFKERKYEIPEGWQIVCIERISKEKYDEEIKKTGKE